ncbi:hypothetical protein [Streptomyces cinnamoneus]|uniref:hypothetical protein n=1 Tax=Streptomyces cinnamoneus TaxID=53446 RepID=UPI0011B0AE58|nr:hypothetical protein [Streptomyces cinnamoneus]
MTYRVGAFVVDRRIDKVGQVMGREGPYVQLRPVGGGREWDCPPAALRLARAAELLGTAGEGARRCAACEAIRAERRAAEEKGDADRMTATATRMGVHLREAH